MATKSKLEQAVEKQIENLNDAQREIVKSQFAVFKKNRERLASIDAKLDAINARPASSVEEVRRKQSERSTLAYEHNQLSIANSKIAAELFNFLTEQP